MVASYREKSDFGDIIDLQSLPCDCVARLQNFKIDFVTLVQFFPPVHQQILELAQGYIRITANVLEEFRGKASFGAQLPSFGLKQKGTARLSEYTRMDFYLTNSSKNVCCTTS